MSISLADKIFVTLGLLDFGGIFIWMGVNFHLAYTKMDYMLEHLKNCSLIKTLTPLNQGGPWGKFLLVGGISGVLTFPTMYIKRGNADADDSSTAAVGRCRACRRPGETARPVDRG